MGGPVDPGEEMWDLTYTEDIYAKAESFAGQELSERETAALESLCAIAGTELERRLKKGVSAQEIQEEFVSAAGVLALSMFMQLSDAGGVGSFKAGNVSVTGRSGKDICDTAHALRRQAEVMLAAYLEDRGFGFVGARG